MSLAPHGTKVLRWTRFKSDGQGNGSEKRSAQIRELCREIGITVEDAIPPVRISRVAAWLRGIQARVRFGRYASVDRAGIGLLGYRAAFYEKALKEHTGARVLLWETTYDTLLPELAKRYGYRVVALPHNLESLVTERAFENERNEVSHDLAAEIHRLALADAVFTISKEERWLLETRGLSPNYLPYYPDSAVLNECLGIREKRLRCINSDGCIEGPLLLMGSAFNPATARGMEQQLRALAGTASREVIVVGPKTDSLFSSHQCPSVRVLGQIDRGALMELLGKCSALLINTWRGAGAVTRIPEALCAGVPIIANANAARDVHGVVGVYEYATEDEFLTLANRLFTLPPIPEKPVEAYVRFENELHRQLGRP